ncbi:unnamed protein product [Trifolium pratense]|uniref:Uncharacterized protein n=1 Tax=Trifolium pratense TaxID=57577 RepID=A0ACB0KN78_TRIPR|nr:unnamed protein product [Trifolium pratense]
MLVAQIMLKDSYFNRLLQSILSSFQIQQVVSEHDVLSCSSFGLLWCGLCGLRETIDCSEVQQIQCIICWTGSRLFPTGG